MMTDEHQAAHLNTHRLLQEPEHQTVVIELDDDAFLSC